MILVTGATGFVGRAMVERLARAQRPVTAARRQGSGSLWSGPGRAVPVGELSPTTDWSMALCGVSAVVHCAARVHVMRESASDPLAAFRQVNVEGTLQLARQAAAAGVRRFVFVSSVKVNGEATMPGHPFRADDPSAAEDAYGISKREAEAGLLQLAASTGLEVVIVRPPLVYGPGVKANFASLARAVAKGVPLPLGAVTGNRRSLVFLDNLVDLLLTCVDHPAAVNQVFLASDGEDLSTADLIRRLAAASGRRARLWPVPLFCLRWGSTLLGRREVLQRLLGSLQVDIGKARELLGWIPPVPVDEGLRRVMQGFSK